MKFAVHLYPTVRVKVTGIEANSYAEAVAKAEAQVDMHEALDNLNPRHTNIEAIEWDEGQNNFVLVDTLNSKGEVIDDKSHWLDGDGVPLVDGLTQKEIKAQAADESALLIKELLGNPEANQAIGSLFSKTFSDLMGLQNAILTQEIVKVDPSRSDVISVIKSLPSAEKWMKYLQLCNDVQKEQGSLFDANGVELFIKAALQHGQDSEPDHEAGDLQEFLREGWEILSLDQRNKFLNHPRLRSTLESAGVSNFKVSEKILELSGIERIIDSFQAHGNNDGPHAEINDLQDAFRACWDILTEGQRSDFYELDSVQETYEAATTKPLFRYFASAGWDHIFVGSRAETTRWVYDSHNEEMIAGQVLNGSDWTDLEPLLLADLKQDIDDNAVILNPEEWYIVQFLQQPSWEDVVAAVDSPEEKAAPAPSSTNES